SSLGHAVDLQVEETCVTGWIQDLRHRQFRFTGVGDSATLVVARGQTDSPIGGAIATDHCGVVTEGGGGAACLANCVCTNGDKLRAGGAVVAHVSSLGHAVDLQ